MAISPHTDPGGMRRGGVRRGVQASDESVGRSALRPLESLCRCRDGRWNKRLE